jgi:hypothetical protein
MEQNTGAVPDETATASTLGLATIVANLLPGDFRDRRFGISVIDAGRKVLNEAGVTPTFGDHFPLYADERSPRV